MSGPVVFHTYRDREISLVGNPIKAVRRETFCGGEWHTTGRAPCELQDADDAAALDAAASCAVDAADIEAAKELLGLSPRVTVCRFKGRASWQDVVVAAEAEEKAKARIAAAQAGVITAEDIIKAMEKM